MTDRRVFILGMAGSVLAAAHIARAQQRLEFLGTVGILNSWPASVRPPSRRMPRMRFGAAATGDLKVEVEALTRAKYGKAVLWTSPPDDDPLSEQASRLARSSAAVIIAVGTPATIAAAEATRVVPIVMVGVADPVALGLVQSLPRPGGNITGVSLLGPETLEKSLDLLLEAAPSIRRLAVMWNPANPGAALSLRHMELASSAKRLEVVPVPVKRPEEVEGLLTDLRQIPHDAFILVNDSVFLRKADRILTYCSERRLPTMFSSADWVMKGGLMSYEPDPTEMYRRAAAYVLKVLGGAKPSDLPVEQPTTFWLAVNAKVGKALGLTIPQSLLVRVDELIE